MYNVTLDKKLKLGDAEKISNGIDTGDVAYSPCETVLRHQGPDKNICCPQGG